LDWTRCSCIGRGWLFCNTKNGQKITTPEEYAKARKICSESMSKKFKGRKRPKIECDAISKANRGKKRTPEQNQKNSERQRDIPKPKVSEALKGRSVPRGQVERAHKNQILAAAKPEYLIKQINSSHKRKCVGIVDPMTNEFISTFLSMRDAERKTNISHWEISKCCSGKFETAGGFIWRYVI